MREDFHNPRRLPGLIFVKIQSDFLFGQKTLIVILQGFWVIFVFDWGHFLYPFLPWKNRDTLHSWTDNHLSANLASFLPRDQKGVVKKSFSEIITMSDFYCSKKFILTYIWFILSYVIIYIYIYIYILKHSLFNFTNQIL